MPFEREYIIKKKERGGYGKPEFVESHRARAIAELRLDLLRKASYYHENYVYYLYEKEPLGEEKRIR